ncbi:MAG: hypothetical protein WBE48_02085, partial [Xanthobacteraceae bacterium]
LHQNISSAQHFGLSPGSMTKLTLRPLFSQESLHFTLTSTPQQRKPRLWGPGLDGRRCSCLGAGMVARAIRILNADDQALVPYAAAMAATEKPYAPWE